MVEFNSFGPAVGRLGSDSSRGGPSRSRGGGSAPLAPLTLTTGADTESTRAISKLHSTNTEKIIGGGTEKPGWTVYAMRRSDKYELK